MPLYQSIEPNKYICLEQEVSMIEAIKAWAYSRIDAPEDNHGSLKHQDQQLCEYAEKMGFKVVGHSKDLAAAYNLDRSGLKALKNAVMEGKVHCILVMDSFRISFDSKKTAAYGAFLQSFGVRIYSADQGLLAELSPPKETMETGNNIQQTSE